MVTAKVTMIMLLRRCLNTAMSQRCSNNRSKHRTLHHRCLYPGRCLRTTGQDPNVMLGSGELEEVDIQPMEQMQTQQEAEQPVAHAPAEPSANQPTNQPTVFNQTIVLPAQPQPQQPQLTPRCSRGRGSR